MPSSQPHPIASLHGRPTDRVLSGLFRESPVPMLLVDVRSRHITRANRALERLLGYEADALEGMPLWKMDTADPADVEEHILLALACGDDLPRHRAWRTAEGDVRSVELLAARLHGDHGTLLALYVRDTQHEQALRQARDEALAQLVRSRNHEAVSRLALDMARDVDGIMDTMEDTVRELQEQITFDMSLAPGLVSVLESGARVRALTQELLAVVDDQELHPPTVSLAAVVQESEEKLREGLPPDIGLMVRYCEEDTDVSTDPKVLREVLGRLVERGHQAMSDGGYLVVTVEVVNLDGDFVREHPSARVGPHAVLGVTDTGKGMGSEARKQVFDSDFQHTEEDSGEGVGMATVYGMIRRSGGTILVTSRPDAGTTFRVYLPLLTD